MHRDIPPLSAVRVFEAVARHLSFTRAANELGMTQAAASYQIKLLEERVGQPLFVRRARRIELTESGRLLAPAMYDAFQRMSAAFATVRDQASGVLRIECQATFAAQWLAQRIGGFQTLHPKLAVRLDATVAGSESRGRDFDLALWAGSGDWPGFTAHLLVESVFTPMLSPRLLAEMGGVARPADLLRFRRFDVYDPWWNRWFETAGVPRTETERSPAECFGTQFFEGRAVLAGQSVGILNPILFLDDLAAGRLVQPFDILGRSDIDGYWLVYPTGHRNIPKIRAFRDWILREIAAQTQSPATSAAS